MPFGRGHALVSSHISEVRERSSPETRPSGSGRRRGSAMRKKGKRTAEVGDKKRVPRNSASYARWHFQTTTRAYSRNVRLTPFGCSRGEIQIYEPTAPGVFFELMKNESGRAALSPPLLSATPTHHPRFSPEAFPNPLYATLPTA